MADLTLHPERFRQTPPLVSSSRAMVSAFRVGMPRRSNRIEDRKKETASTLAAWHNAGTLPTDQEGHELKFNTGRGSRKESKVEEAHKGKAFALKSYPQKNIRSQ